MSSSVDVIVSQLFERDPPVLEPGTAVWDKKLVKDIEGLTEHSFVIAALHLANDDIDRCHNIAQASEGDATADLLHATLHRREGDYWNSKYWFNRLGPHPLVPSKAKAKAFVDSCEKATSGNDDALREQQWEELKALVEWTRANCK